MIRLFVALELPESVSARLTLMGGGVPGARWQRQEQLHLTLRFIGEVDEGIARDIDDALSGIREPRFPLEIFGVGQFGGKLPHTLWAGVRSSEALLHLQRKIETTLQRLGLQAEQRKFTPHVTLAKLKSPPREKVLEFLSHNGLFSLPSFTVERFALFSSQLSPNGSIYRVERTYALEESRSSMASMASSDKPK